MSNTSSTKPFIFHPGTGTYMALSECVTVNVPVDMDNDDIESYLFEYGGNELTRIGGTHD